MIEEPRADPGDEVVISAIQGTVIRLATVCESILEEAGTRTSSVIRMIDVVDYSPDDLAHGNVSVPGFVAFMGYGFPGEAESEQVDILFATEAGEVLGVLRRTMTIHGVERAFAMANTLASVIVPRPGRYAFALVHNQREIARTYVTARFPEGEEELS